MKSTPYIFLCLLLPFLGFSQENEVFGQVLDNQKQPISYANVLLMNVQDSTVVKGVSTNDEGLFKLTSVANDSYNLKISFIGYKDFYKTISVENDLDLKQIILEEAVEDLDEISITVKKPTLKREADRLVFNIENTALIEGNMLQVLKSTPGVLVIGDEIKVKNSNPTVYINNRKVHLSSSELTDLLEGSSANTIKSVEVITNPSAKYDAESGVVLNIVMSKNLATGYRGNVFANYTQGVFPRYNVGMNHFFKSEKINFFANYTYNEGKINRNNREEVNYLDDNFDIAQIWKSKINRNTWSKKHNLNFNLDYTLDDKNTLSLSSNMLWQPYFKYRISNKTNIFDASEDLQAYYLSKNLSNDDKYNLGFDLDFVHQFKKGQLSVNSHFTTYNYERNQNVGTDFFEADNTFVESTAYKTNNNQDTKILTGQLDYSLPINESSTFETGVKAANIKTNSDIIQLDIVNNQEIIDPNNTNAFKYDENVYAAYFNYTKDWEKWSIIAGLRTEQTKVEGISVLNNEINKQDYLEWFPTASISYAATDNFSLYANYKRSISRPDFQSLNPFNFFINDNTVVVGNPNLQPEFIDYSVIGTSLFNLFIIEAYYKNTKNTIYELPRQNNDTNIITYAPLNFDKTIEYGFDFHTYFDVSERWFLYFVTSFYNTQDEVVFDNVSIKQDQWSNYSVLSNDFSFLKDKSLTANLTLTWAGKNIQGLRIVENRLISNLSISKTIWNKRAVISLVAEDLFNTHNFDDSTRYLNQYSSSFTDTDDRTIMLGFRYKFGNTKLSTNERSKDVKERDRLEKKQ